MGLTQDEALAAAPALAVPADDAEKSRESRGSLVRRVLLLADGIGLTSAFVITSLAFGPGEGAENRLALGAEYALFLLTLPLWMLAAKLYELYDRDEERTEHTTLDDLVSVLHLVTLGAWLLFLLVRISGVADPELAKVGVFWLLAVTLVTLSRAVARSYARRRPAYIQNALIVGAGEVGQRVARKLVQHPEYGINLVGFVDADPLALRADIDGRGVLGRPDDLTRLVERHRVDRVVIAFSNEPASETVDLVRSLKRLAVQVDIVPRLFDVVGPNVLVHSIEGLTLVGLPTPKLLPFSRAIKRAIDVVGAALLLAATAPLFAFVAWRVKRDTPGPVFFRQVRLGEGMRPFTALKFRTMRVDTDDSAHRAFIRATMDAGAAPAENGLYKLERDDAVTPSGRWLRRTSLDELPQLLNVLRGDMSLVGPRPCIDYETETFLPHHFERFDVPAGVTGLWQVTARAHSTFGEALDLDVAYARSWSLLLDLSLLLRTPLCVLRPKATA
jgi:exopolysaccharide biosynthesis polyprenyl glycosylphosphotransferase